MGMAALACVRRVQIEEEQSVKTFELFDVEVPTSVQRNSPTLHLPRALGNLSDVWNHHCHLGLEADAAVKAEVMEMLDKVDGFWANAVQYMGQISGSTLTWATEHGGSAESLTRIGPKELVMPYQGEGSQCV